MKLVADENVESAIVSWLREQNHDIIWMTEFMPGMPDPEIIKLAQRDERILITGDLDFGEHVYRRHMAPTGVILLRFRLSSQIQRLASLQKHWPAIESRMPGRYIVVAEHAIRVRPLPGSMNR